MRKATQLALVTTSAALVAVFVGIGRGQQPPRQPADAVQEAQTSRDVPLARPELRQTDHDRSGVFGTPSPSSPVLDAQPDKGRETGFVFGRDPHNAKRLVLSLQLSTQEKSDLVAFMRQL